MTTKRAIWMLAVPVIVVGLIAVLGFLGIKHQGPTVSEVIPSARPKAAAAGVIAPGIPKERLYKVEAVSFRAVDESGVDWLGSDEIYANWIDPKSGYVSVTRTYKDVDTGDTRKFSPPDKQCILPVDLPSPTFVSEGTKACSGGVPGPFDFEVALFEDDKAPPPLFNFCPEHPRAIWPSCDGDRPEDGFLHDGRIGNGYATRWRYLHGNDRDTHLLRRAGIRSRP